MSLLITVIVISIIALAVLIMVLVLRKKECYLHERVLESTSSKRMLNVPARRMWGWGFESAAVVGYCGEAAYQSVMIYYGNYVSQEQVYKAGGNSTFLLGVNDDTVCGAFHMDYVRWPSTGNVGIDDMLSYLKKQIDQNRPVLMGLFTKEAGGDSSFDHTCPIYGYELNNGHIDTLYYGDLYQLSPVALNCSVNKSTGLPHCYQTRTECSSGISIQPLDQCIPDVRGLKNADGSDNIMATCTLLGNNDPKKELFPVMLIMDRPDEPDWGIEDAINAVPVAISCTAVIGCLESGKGYSLLRFDNLSDIPNGGFLDSTQWTMRVDFIAVSDTYKITVTDNPQGLRFLSNGTYFFRCTENTNPSAVSKYPSNVNRCDTSQGLPSSNPSSSLSALGASKMKRVTEERKKRRIKTARSAAPSKALAKCPTGTAISPGIKCGNSVYGFIAKNWVWNFQNDSLGCFPVTFALSPDIDAEALDSGPDCISFNATSTTAGKINDGTTGIIGADGRLYIDDNMSWKTMAYQIGVKDGVYTMRSQDGTTTSTLYAISS